MPGPKKKDKDVPQPLWDLWPSKGEGLVKGEFQYKRVNLVVKKNGQCVPGA